MIWFKKNADIIKVVTLVAAMIVWLYNNFGTVGMVKAAEANMRLYVDEKHVGVDKRLESMENLMMKVDDRLYQIQKELRK